MAKVEGIPMDFRLKQDFDRPIPNSPILTNKYDLFIQELQILFDTNRYDVLCSPHGWPGIKDYVFSTNVSNVTLGTLIQEAIADMCPTATDIDYSIGVKFVRGELSDIAIIDLTITPSEDDLQEIKKQYYIG